jgi:3-hydroxyisobutyrate dehydrogenase-like beta-hydroxyacid dehydrogenase
VTSVGIVSPGAMGSALGRVLVDGGARVVATVSGRSERTIRLAEAAGLELLGSLADVVAASDVVLSVAPPDHAEAIARDVRAHGPALLVDMNAVSPLTVGRIAPDVDASISGGPPREGATTRVYASGPRAAEFAALPWDERVDVHIVGDELGLASAVKMCTASVYKGTNALLAHALVTARAHGVLEYVLDDLAERATNAPRRIANIASKSRRFVGEMREIAETQAAVGLPHELFEGVAAAYEGLARTEAASRDPEDVDDVGLEDVLDEIMGRKESRWLSKS